MEESVYDNCDDNKNDKHYTIVEFNGADKFHFCKMNEVDIRGLSGVYNLHTVRLVRRRRI
jgi:hypothetical protein